MLLRLLIAFTIALLAAAYFLAPEDIDGTPAVLSQGLAKIRSLSGTDRQTSSVYKWQDAEGGWHFSTTPPPAGIASEVQIYRNDSNVIQAPRPTAPPKTTATRQPAAETSSIPGLSSVNNAKDALNDARAVQDLNDQRIDTLNKQIDANQ